MAHLLELARQPLDSPPGMARITKINDRYTFTRTYHDDTPPDITTNLSQLHAYSMLADALHDDLLN